MKDFQDSSVAEVFSRYPHTLRKKLLEVRALIFQAASPTSGVGPLEETLKWGQPSYLPSLSGSGTTIRIDRIPSSNERYGVFFHCQTSLVATFRERFGALFEFQGNRAIVFDVADPMPRKELRTCFAEALTYHLQGKRNKVQTLRPPAKAGRKKDK